MLRKITTILLGLCLYSASADSVDAGVVFRLPTANNALFSKEYDRFYMYVDRNFEGVKSKPWEGGAYGFTRTLVRTQAGPVAIKFHEGIDVKPLKRDASGNPLDKIHPCAAGRVVHVCNTPSHSSYGRYVVIEHMLPDGPLYSLYAHLASTSCKVGDRVGTGNVIGILGYSGPGLNRERSHLHLEFCMMINRNFDEWYKNMRIAAPNRHGLFNGLNLIGMNPADVLESCKDGAPFSLRQYIAAQPFQYKVRIPSTGQLDLVKRYPFLLKQGPANPVSWEIAFAGSGLPLSVTPSSKPCDKPVVFEAVPHPFTQLYRTANRVSGSSKAPVLTGSGRNYMQLISIRPGGR